MGDFLFKFKSMKNYFLVLLLFVVFSISKSHAQFINDVRGRPVTELRYTNITGSPYYNDKFVTGTVKLEGNLKETSALIQYDQIGDLVLVKNKLEDQPIEVTDKIAVFKLFMPTDTVSFRSLPGLEGYYEVLYDGSTPFFKRTKKKIIDNQIYNSAAIEKTVNSALTYYIITKSKEVVQVKLDKKGFLNVLNDKSKELSDFISMEKINFKEQKDIIKLLSYYDGLK